MGLYGSPALGPYKDDGQEQIKRKRTIKVSSHVIVLIVLYLLLVLNNEDKFVMTVSYVGVMSMVYFVANFAIMIYKLIKKQSVNREVIKILACMTLFAICIGLG